MKQLLVPTACVLLGCVAGIVVPSVLAQPSAPPPVRWEQECEEGSLGTGGALQHMMRERGAAGWEAFGVASRTSSGMGIVVVCYKRPAR
jgi:hypothetical protein